MPTAESVAAATRIMILATLGFWLAWDVAVAALCGPYPTISLSIWRWGQDHPWFPLAYFLVQGFLAWHFFVNPHATGLLR